MAVTGLNGLGRFWWSAKTVAGPLPGTEVRRPPFTTIVTESAVPHAPAASRPRIQMGTYPSAMSDASSVSCTATVGEVKAPLIAVPVPGATGAIPIDHSAPLTFEFP